MSSAEYSCKLFKPIFCIPANSVDPDKTAPKGAVWSGSTLFAKKLLKLQAEDKADDNCCDWRFRINIGLRRVDTLGRFCNILCKGENYCDFLFVILHSKILLKKCLITKTCLYNFDPLKPHFYIVKLVFTGYTLFFVFLLKNIDCGTR